MIKMINKNKKSLNLVCKVNEDISIFSDPYNYILCIKGRNRIYLSTFSMIIDELYEQKECYLLSKKIKKDLESVKDAIEEAKEWVKKISENFINLKLDK